MTCARHYSIATAMLFAGTFGLFVGLPASADTVLGLKTIKEVRHAQTQPLRNLIATYARQPGPEIAAGGKSGAAAVMAAAPNTTDLLNFEGVDFICNPPGWCVTPSPNGAVGATQYVQWVNTEYEIYDKSSGAPLSAPISGNALWLAAFGPSDPCGGNNTGDPVVLYDKAAGRWVLEQPETETAPYFLCVAVSMTSDALGNYNVYEFSLGSSANPLNPRFGAWPASGNSGYFLTFDRQVKGKKGYTLDGSMLCGVDRTSMLAGGAATIQCFQLSSSYGGVLPADFDGTILPPAGADERFANLSGSSAVNFWRMHIDFANPANTALAGPNAVPVPRFTPLCGSAGGNCVPQKGVSNGLESIADRLMYRLAYRNFGDHESLVTNHSVEVNRRGAVRWYEFRNPANPALFQSGNITDTALWYWMASAAMDKAGDMAIGFSSSSGDTYPSINYAGRSAGDATGTMNVHAGPTTAGGGSQTIPYWGHRSSMSIDPVDDCTFFYTAEYLQATGGFWSWSTRINSFRFNNCN